MEPRTPVVVLSAAECLSLLKENKKNKNSHEMKSERERAKGTHTHTQRRNSTESTAMR